MRDHQPPTSLTMRIPAEMADAMRQLATQHDRSLNGEVARALRDYLERHQDGR